jgi:serine O-acetyltransferase
LNELNITPLLDLVFVLLVIFIITTPQMMNNLEMNLPSPKPPPPQKEKPKINYDQFVPELLASYAAVGGLNNRDAHNMPSTRAVGQICEDLLQLLFPGFHDDDAVHHGTLAELTSERLSKGRLRLGRSGAQKRPHRRPEKPTGRTPPILRHFFHSLSEVRELLRTDIEAAYEGDPAALYSEEIILSYPFIEAIAIQRLAHILYVRARRSFRA